MRIRSIRPEFFSSEDVAAMDWHTRLVFIGLWSYVDDNGVGRDVEPLIVAALFPLDGDLTESSRRVHAALKRLSEGGQIVRYRVEGKPYFHVCAWSKHQKINRASEGRYPLPDGDSVVIQGGLTEDSLSPQAETPLGEGEKGRRGEEQTCASDDARESTMDPLVAVNALEEEFSEWWAAYPRKKDKKPAEKAYRSARKRASAATLLAGAEAYAAEVKGRDIVKVKLGGTWLNGDCWENEPETSTSDAERLYRENPYTDRARMAAEQGVPEAWL